MLEAIQHVFNSITSLGNKLQKEHEDWHVCHYCQFELPNCRKDYADKWICEECYQKAHDDLIENEIDEILLEKDEQETNKI